MAHPDRRLADQTPAEVNGYLMELGRNPALKDYSGPQDRGMLTAWEPLSLLWPGVRRAWMRGHPTADGH